MLLDRFESAVNRKSTYEVGITGRAPTLGPEKAILRRVEESIWVNYFHCGGNRGFVHIQCGPVTN